MTTINDIAETQRIAIASLNQRMADFEAHLKASSPGADLSGLTKDFSTFKEHVWNVFTVLQNQIAEFSQSIDVIEMRHRKKFLLLGGVQEETDERPTDVVVSILQKHLGLPDIAPSSLQVCHRMGSASEGRPRPILIRFLDSAYKNQVWNTKTKLKGTSYVLSEFLTRRRQSAFSAARKLFGVNNVWTMDGSINIKLPDGKRRRVYSSEEVLALGTEHGRSMNGPEVRQTAKVGSKGTETSTAPAASRSRRNAHKK
ncbi:hypothetical protein HF086_007605 [Spodoptera exigua]|uniref:Uncharacterized protein n=1 Tax=Spodoptera exigua TaxID=7107 RepID=A0A922MTJ6_SPOEX|nr:hypothetical protein HF086_007605 [Spodoptera exigua]